MKGKNKVSGTFAILLLIISIFIVIQFPIPVYANPGSAEVKVDSATYTYPINDIGDTVVLAVSIRNLTTPPDNAVNSWAASFSFDTKILSVTSVIEGYFLNQSGPTTFDDGTVVGGAITGVMCNLTAGLNSTGSGVLAYLVFTVKSFGSTAVSITSIYAQDPTGTEITTTPVNGSFGMAMPVSLPSMSYVYDINNIGDTVVMPLSIQTSTSTTWGGVLSWEASFWFDTKILSVTSVLEGYFLNKSGPTTFDDGTVVGGTITGVKCNFTTADSYNSTGSGVLAYLVFTVVNFGSTDVNITSIYVSVGDPHAALVASTNGHFDMGLTVSFPSISYSYPINDIGNTVVMDLKIKAPPLTSWSGGITSWKANFSYNPTVLNITSVLQGGYLSPIANTTFNPGNTSIPGTITDVACALDPGLNSTGSGVLVYLVFEVIGAGDSDIKITDFWLNGTAGEIPVTTVDGYFCLGAKLELVPRVTWTYPTRNIGESFTMNLNVTAAELTSWQTGLKFDPDVVIVDSIAIGPYPSMYGPVEWIYLPSYINNTAGTVKTFGAALKSNVSAPATGPGGATVAIVTFNVTGAGNVTIELTNPKVLEVDQNIEPLTIGNGYFELGAIMELGPPVPWMYPAHNIGDVFQMNITIKTAELYSWQTGLKFDPDVVNVKNITLGAGFYLNQSGPIQTFYSSSYINNVAGTVKTFGCTLLGSVSAPATGSAGKVEATIWFNVTGAGSTTIELTNAEAVGTEIPVTTVDGQFSLGATMALVPALAGPVRKCTTFQWNIVITAAELYSWQVGLKFDPQILNVNSIALGAGFYLNNTGPVQTFYSSGYIDNVAGTVKPFGETLLGNVSASATGPGGAVIATITFKVVGYVTSPPYRTTVQLTNATAFGSTASGSKMPVTTVNGQFKLKIGDCNADSTVNVLDIILVLINPGPVNSPPYRPCWADINGDGTVNVLDIILVLINPGAY